MKSLFFVLLAAFIFCAGNCEALTKWKIAMITSEGSANIADALQLGCKRAAAEYRNLDCVRVEPAGSEEPEKVIADIETLVAAGSDALIISVGFDGAPWLKNVLQHAKSSGVISVVVASGAMNDVEPLKDYVTAIVGVRAETLIDKLLASAEMTGDNANFCLAIVPWAQNDIMPNLGMIQDAMLKKGFKATKNCPIYYESESNIDAGVFFKDRITLTDTDIVLLPFYYKPIAQPWPSLSGQKNATVLTAWPSTSELAYYATMEALKIIPGETVEKFNEAPSVIQIGTEKFCETCDCQKDSDCKNNCPKCD